MPSEGDGSVPARLDGRPDGDDFPDHLFEQAERRFQAIEAEVAKLHRGVEAGLPNETAYLALPCPRCEGVNRFVVVDPPRTIPCRRCGAPIDPTEPAHVRTKALDDVITGTTVSLVVLVTAANHPLATFASWMKPAATMSKGRFAVIVLDGTAEPEAATRTGLRAAPGIAFYHHGIRQGGLNLPSAGTQGAGLADLFGSALSGGSGLALPWPPFGEPLDR